MRIRVTLAALPLIAAACSGAADPTSTLIEFAAGGIAEGTITSERTGPAPAPPVDGGDGATGALDGEIAAFLDDLAAAFRAGDGDHLLVALHPAVLDWYGEDQCTGFTGGAQIPDMGFEILDVAGPQAWTFEQDGASTPVDEVYSVTVIREDLGAERELHLAVLDGGLRWFTDCGDPS